MTAYDDILRTYREFKRYTGDGLPGEPAGAPLPVGDPQSGPHNPKKSELRATLGGLAQDLLDGISLVNGMIPALAAARDAALADIGLSLENALNGLDVARLSALSDVGVLVDEAEAARDIAAGYASDAVSQGNVPIYGTVLGMPAVSVPAGINAVRLNGFQFAGDAGDALYVKSVSEPDHDGKFQSDDGAWWELAPPDRIVTPQMFGAKADGVNDDHPATQKAVEFLWEKYGGGVIYFPPGTYLVDSSLRLDGKSNIGLKGAPGHKSVLKASASLNGSSNSNKNDIVFAVNYPTGPVINARQSNIWAEDLVFDGTLQNADGVPNEPAGGFSLAGIECSRVDYPRVIRCKFIKCYGNGVVFSSGAVSTLYAEDGVTRNGVEHGIVEDCEFIEVCRGPLPNYASSVAPMGIPGAAIQIGAAFSAKVVNNHAYRLGGTFLECFNNEGMSCVNNTISGTPITVTGGNTNSNGEVFQSLFGTIKSDFGLLDSHIVGNTFIECGGIELLGNMGGNFFNANTPTSGPKNCIIADNLLIRPTGNRGLGAVAVKPSGSGNVYTASQIQTDAIGLYTNQVMRIIITGGSGITVYRRRGTGGSWTTVTLGPSQSFLLFAGDAFYLEYSGAPSAIGAVLTPNALKSGITIVGGTAAKQSATVMVSIASPGVVTWTGHGLTANQMVRFTTTGALPTGLATGTTYYVKTVLDANTFTLSAAPGGAVINTTGEQSGAHTASQWITGSAERNTISNNTILNPGAFGVQITDGSYNALIGNHVENPGLAQSFGAFWLGQSVDQTGTGCFDNDCDGNRIFDTRSVKFLTYNFLEAGTRTLNNRFHGNRLEVGTVSSITIANTPTIAGGSSIADNYGPGAASVALTAPSIPASNTELHNPFPYNCVVYVAGGTVTAINTGPASATVATGMTSGPVTVKAGERIRLTYSVAPSWVWRPVN